MTQDDVDRVAKKYLKPEETTILVVGDRKVVEPKLKDLPLPADDRRREATSNRRPAHSSSPNHVWSVRARERALCRDGRGAPPPIRRRQRHHSFGLSRPLPGEVLFLPLRCSVVRLRPFSLALTSLTGRGSSWMTVLAGLSSRSP